VQIVIVAPSPVPLVIGGAERLWWGLLDHLNRDTPHTADLIKLPGAERNFFEAVDSYRRFSELDLRGYDAVISGKYPAWMTQHPNQVCYMLHPLRGLYDTYPRHLREQSTSRHPEVRALLRLIRGADRSREALAECFKRVDRLTGARRSRRLRLPVPRDTFAFPGALIREIVHFCDEVAFVPGAIRRFSAISGEVARRSGYFPSYAQVTPVHPPSNLTGFHQPSDAGYFFTVSRLDGPKRIGLLIEATKLAGEDVQLVIAGSGPERARLEEMAGSDARIRFLGFVNDDALLDLYAGARAVPFVPLQEDFGMVAVEAMSAGKAVITTDDSGGTADLVTDGITGLITAPSSNAIAEALVRLHRDPQLARSMGARGREIAAEVSWKRVSSVLLEGIEP
jgi:glycosyltransferase involved in cell wall biosynthesis